MEMESVHGNANIVSVYCFYYIVCCSKLVDRAVRCTAELQGDLHICAHFVRKIAKACNCFFFDLADRFVFYIKTWNCYQHFHSDRFGNFQDKIYFFIDFFFPCLISLVEKDQGVVCPRFQVMILKPVCQFFQCMFFEIVFYAVKTDLNVIKAIFFTHLQICHKRLSFAFQCSCFIKS